MSGSVHAGRRESMMAFNCFLCMDISPGPDGIKPLFLAISKQNGRNKKSSLIMQKYKSNTIEYQQQYQKENISLNRLKLTSI